MFAEYLGDLFLDILDDGLVIRNQIDLACGALRFLQFSLQRFFPQGRVYLLEDVMLFRLLRNDFDQRIDEDLLQQVHHPLRDAGRQE